MSPLTSIVSMAMDAPEKIRVAAMSSAVLAVVGVSVYSIATVGYLRPFWTHHSMDIEACAREAADRLITRTEEVRTCLEEHAEHPVTTALLRSYPSLRDFASSRGPGREAPGGDLDRSELLDAVFEGMLNVSTGPGPVLESALRLAEGPNVCDILKPFSGSDSEGLGKQCPEAVQRAACAIADARLVAVTIAKPLTELHSFRSMKMNLPDTVMFHVAPDFNEFVGQIRRVFNVSRNVRVRAKKDARVLVDVIDTLATKIMWGEPNREEFIGKIGKLAISLIKVVVPLSKMALKVIGILVGSIDDIVVLLGVLVKGVSHIARELTTKGLLAGIASLVRFVIGFALKVVVALCKGILIDVIAIWLAFWAPVVNGVSLTIIFALDFAAKLCVALADYATDGTVRFLANTDQDPNAWWKKAGFELGNVYRRNVVAWTPCMAGFTVSDSGVFCMKVPSGVPSRSPAALIARRYFRGSFGEFGRILPSRDAASLERYSRLCRSEYKRSLQADKYAHDLVKTLVLCRLCVLGGGPVMDELSHYATGVDPTDVPPHRLVTSFGQATILAAATVACVGFTFLAVRSRSLRALTDSHVSSAPS